MSTYCFYETYEKDIAPVLRDIDILLKTSDNFIDREEAESILGLPCDELDIIMDECRFNSITKKNFMEIMKRGSSPICKLYQRELECGSPYIYKKSEISYIYGIDIHNVESACRSLGIEEITTGVLPLLFSRI